MASQACRAYQTLCLKDWTVLITGASSGIGEACAWRFAQQGCRLVLVARRADRLEALKAQLVEACQVPVHVVTLDMQRIPDVEALPSSLPPEFQAVDILVNNAGLALGVASVEDNNVQDATIMIATNVTSVVAITKAFVKGMIQRNRGHIVNMSSIAGHEAYSGGSVYCATKHALDAFTKSIRHDLVASQVRVTSISPGAVNTEFSTVRFKGDKDKADAVYTGFDPLMAEDIADNVLYACTSTCRCATCWSWPPTRARPRASQGPSWPASCSRAVAGCSRL